MRFNALLGLIAVLSACRATAPGPSDTVAAYADALREGRLADAWQLLSPAAQQSMSEREFEALVRAQPDAVDGTVAAYAGARRDGPMRAQLELSNGDSIALMYEEGAWRVDPASLDFYSQATPVAALRSFVRAVERERWDVLMRLAPRAVASQLRMASSEPSHAPEELLREAWTGARSQRDRDVLRVLGQSLERGATPELADDRATLTYGIANRYTARLVREDGQWRVEDTD